MAAALHNDTHSTRGPARRNALNGEAFIAPNGRDYCKTERVNLREVRLYLEQKGFRVERLEQLYRHVTGKLQQGSQCYFFKMASTPVLSDLIFNESTWNQLVGEALAQRQDPPFLVPRILATGTLGPLRYFIGEFFEGPPIARANPPSTEKLEEYLPHLVEAGKFLLQTSVKTIPRDVLEFGNCPDLPGYLHSVDTRLITQLPEFELESVLEISRSLKDRSQPGLCHGHFVPWHMVKHKGRFALVDSELGSSVFPKYYDTAYLFHGMYTEAHVPELAKEYLRMLRRGLPVAEQADFYAQLRPLIASRLITGFWRAKNYGWEPKFDMRLRDDLLSDRLS